MGSDHATCSSCGADIVWTVTVTGKRMPLDVQERAGATFVVHIPSDPRKPLQALAATSETARLLIGRELASRPRFDSHFATCPSSDQHRKPRNANTK